MEPNVCSKVLEKDKDYWIDGFLGEREKSWYFGLNNESYSTKPYKFKIENPSITGDNNYINVEQVFKKKDEDYTDITPVKNKFYFASLPPLASSTSDKDAQPPFVKVIFKNISPIRYMVKFEDKGLGLEEFQVDTVFKGREEENLTETSESPSTSPEPKKENQTEEKNYVETKIPSEVFPIYIYSNNEYVKVEFRGNADLKYVVEYNKTTYEVDDLYECNNDAKGGKYRKKTERKKCRKSKRKDSRKTKKRRSRRTIYKSKILKKTI